MKRIFELIGETSKSLSWFKNYNMVGKRILYFLNLNQQKPEWLAEQLNISVTQVRRMANNKCTVSAERLYKIVQIFKISLIDLFEEEHLAIPGSSHLGKYGPIENSFIRFLIHQNELLRKEQETLIQLNGALMQNLQIQQTQIQKVIDVLIEKENKKNKSQGGKRSQ